MRSPSRLKGFCTDSHGKDQMPVGAHTIEHMFDQKYGEDMTHLFAGAKAPASAAEQIDRIALWERVITHAQAQQAQVIAAYASRRADEDHAAGAFDSEAGKYAAEEIALARRVSPTTASYHIAFAQGLVEHHRATLRAMLSGTISMPAARTIVAECQMLEPADRRTVDTDISLEAAELTPGQVRTAVRRRVLAADAKAAAKRSQQARARKRVSLLPREDSTAALYGLLPAEQAAACWTALDDHARAARADGDERSIDHIMCDTLVERITGQRQATDVRVEVGIVISAASLLGHDEAPATLGRYGAVPPELARRLADSRYAWSRRLLCDPVDGQVIDVSSRRRRFTGGLRRLIEARDQVCRMPVCDAPIRDGDHVKPYSQGGNTDLDNGQGLCERSHYCRDHPGWQASSDPDSSAGAVRWITPTGHEYESRPPPALGHGSLDSESLRRLNERRRRRRKRRRRR